VRLGQTARATDAGRKRRHNEDAYVVQPPLFAIADGMGGAQAGEIASALAAGALKDSRADGGGEARVVELIQEANRRVHERASTDAATSGMGTTMTVALVERDGKVTFGHVGDSRAYLLREGELEQLTNDHSHVAELVRRGELSPQEAEVHPQRSVITRALGTDPDVDVDAFTIDALPGDVYLICSDGLSDMIGAPQIEEVLRASRDDLDRAARALVQAANKSGGEDNITAVLFEIVGDDAEAADAEPDAPTVEAAAVAFDEEDTLHPEDNVQPPPAAAPTSVDTMVVRTDEIRAAVDAAEEEKPHVSFARRLLVVLVILALIAIIVVLVLWGLAR
jgi:serine/threonine protein phosphatase PrpC